MDGNPIDDGKATAVVAALLAAEPAAVRADTLLDCSAWVFLAIKTH